MGTSIDPKHFLTNTAKRIIDKPKKERTPVSLEDIRAAQSLIADLAIRTPLVRLNVDDAPAEIYLKLENLQPINSFKIRGAGNAMRMADPGQLAQGVWTASAGNMAQGVAWCARQLGHKCRVVAGDHALTHRSDHLDRSGVAPDHRARVIADRDDDIVALRDRHDGRLVEHDAAAVLDDDHVRRAQVDADALAEHTPPITR